MHFLALTSIYLIFILAIISALIIRGANFIFYKMLQAENMRHIIDITKNTCSYPGEKAADEIEDYIKKEW